MQTTVIVWTVCLYLVFVCAPQMLWLDLRGPTSKGGWGGEEVGNGRERGREGDGWKWDGVGKGMKGRGG